jgi:hypothetical protein
MHELHGKRRTSRQVPHWVRDNGGRDHAGDRNDCVIRAIAIAAGKPYREVHSALIAATAQYVKTSRSRVAGYIRQSRRGRYFDPANGSYAEIYRPYLESIGWQYTATKARKVRLRADMLPAGRLIVRVHRHLTAVINGTIHDTFNSGRAGHRPVIGYFAARAS